MSGLMGALWRIRFLVPLPQVQGLFLVMLVNIGPIVSGVILMMMLVMTGPLSLAVVIALFLVLCRLFRGLSSGEVILALQAADGIHMVLTIWVWYVMLVACCMALVALVLLSL